MIDRDVLVFDITKEVKWVGEHGVGSSNVALALGPVFIEQAGSRSASGKTPE